MKDVSILSGVNGDKSRYQSSHEYNFYMDRDIQKQLLEYYENEQFPKPVTKASQKYVNVGKSVSRDQFGSWIPPSNHVPLRNNEREKTTHKETPTPSWKDRDRTFGPPIKDYEFKHYNDCDKYIEQYRLYHTCQPPMRAMSARQLRALHEAREKTIGDSLSQKFSDRYVERESSSVLIHDLLSSQPKQYVNGDTSLLHRMHESQNINGLKIEPSTCAGSVTESDLSHSSLPNSRNGSAKNTIQARAGGNINLTPKAIDNKYVSKASKIASFAGKSLLKSPQQGIFEKTISKSATAGLQHSRVGPAILGYAGANSSVQTVDLLSNIASNNEKQIDPPAAENDDIESVDSIGKLSTKCLAADHLEDTIESVKPTCIRIPNPSMIEPPENENENKDAWAVNKNACLTRKKGRTSSQKYGAESFSKTFPRNVQEHEQNGTEQYIVYQHKSVPQYTSHIIDADEILRQESDTCMIPIAVDGYSDNSAIFHKTLQLWRPPQTAPNKTKTSSQGFSKPFYTNERQSVTAGKQKKSREYTIIPSTHEVLSLTPMKNEKTKCRSRTLNVTLDGSIGPPVPMFKHLGVNTNSTNKSKALYRNKEYNSELVTKAINGPKVADIVMFDSGTSLPSHVQKTNVTVMKGLKSSGPAIVSGAILGDFYNLTWTERLDFLRRLPKLEGLKHAKSLEDLRTLSPITAVASENVLRSVRKCKSTVEPAREMTVPKLRLVSFSQPRVNLLNDQVSMTDAGGFGNYCTLRTSREDRDRYNRFMDDIKQKEKEFQNCYNILDANSSPFKKKKVRKNKLQGPPPGRGGGYKLHFPILQPKLMAGLTYFDDIPSDHDVYDT